MSVVIAPFANERIKEWPVRQYRRFIELMIERDDVRDVAIVGTTPQRVRANDIVRGFSADRVHNLCGRLAWPELEKRVSTASLVVANNSGVAHLGASRGRWTLCILGAAHSWLEWMPRGPRVVVISKAPACAPCEVGDGICPNGIQCLTALEADFVHTRLRKIQYQTELSA